MNDTQTALYDALAELERKIKSEVAWWLSKHRTTEGLGKLGFDEVELAEQACDTLEVVARRCMQLNSYSDRASNEAAKYFGLDIPKETNP